MAALVLPLIIIIALLALQLFRYQQKLQQAQQQQNRLKQILDHAGACIYTKNRYQCYTYANKPCLEIFQIDESQLPDFSDSHYFPLDTQEQLKQIDQKVLDQGQANQEEVIVERELGNPTVYLETKHPLKDHEGEINELVGISTDVTELWRLKQALEMQANIDPLTGIANRLKLDAIFQTEIDRANRYQTPLCVLLGDIDHFKRVNDSHGHQVGDRVLITVAQLIQSSLRSSDHAGRWGGEEFLIICPQTELGQARRLADRIRLAVAGHQFENDCQLSICFGVAAFNQGDSVSSLTSKADKALYRAKESGRNRVCQHVQ
ncbi:PAS domain S-box-containing protein/diguanylate cyclase (GGDEF) domain-containing protein [Ferrimonas sediminum]|uniref:diguanylate cyclase n=1 Tax=Ferrimonas sediminum TaxID=718193 RepID=A0A1G8VJ00_9GAMM|nr:GGDEF domain-containing protein [Ferrimonas sediminum]SDJ65150.1 PAS domain S-box-containing protein/diguanylate cyclase (GGDEF) domain-containing protein [Ferrimonas sediminum]